MNPAATTVALTGGTGYIGGRLLPLLEGRGVRLRCLTRRPGSIRAHVSAGTQIAQADVLDPRSLNDALVDVDTAYYLVHSMGARSDFEQSDRHAAANFAAAVRQNGVRRIIYLGGLGDADGTLSPHLRSRQEVGNILRTSEAQVIEFRASIIIGSGSLSFELIRSLVERLPVMICPRWVATLTQPIGVEDVLQYLVAALDLPPGLSRTFEIGGPDQVSYGEIMREYARQRRLRRRMISVPVLTPRLSSLWLGLVTPIYARIGRKLIEGVRNPTLVTDPSAVESFSIRPRGLGDAIRRALANEDRTFAETRWSDALSSASDTPKWGGTRFSSRLVDSRVVDVAASTDAAFASIQKIGGSTGWYYGDWLWQVRGLLDLLAGGVGLRRGRRHPVELREGDALDFWRVERFEPGRLLRLEAEMRVPGRAWLEFEVSPRQDAAQIRQTAIFDPAGLSGLAYWYALYLIHEFVFAGMLRGIVQAAERLESNRAD